MDMVDRVASAFAGLHITTASGTVVSPGAVARAAILAMREPTEAMIDAALHDYATHGPRQSPFGQDGSFAATWQAMIDEVLK